MEDMALLGFVVVWLGGSLLVGWTAAERKRSSGSWCVLAVLFSPLLAAICLNAVPPKSENGRIRCTECMEEISPEAKLCPFCRSVQNAPAEQCVTKSQVAGR